MTLLHGLFRQGNEKHVFGRDAGLGVELGRGEEGGMWKGE